MSNELQVEKTRNGLLENEINTLSSGISQERNKYQGELSKISNQIKKLRNIQNIYVEEKKNSEKLENRLNQRENQYSDLSTFLRYFIINYFVSIIF